MQASPTGQPEFSLLREAVEMLRNVGLFGALVLFVLAGYRRWIVWGHQADDLKRAAERAYKERDEWRSIAVRNLQTTQTVLDYLMRLRNP